MPAWSEGAPQLPLSCVWWHEEAWPSALLSPSSLTRDQLCSLCLQSPHEAVLEALGYVLSQLLQAKEAPTEIIP